MDLAISLTVDTVQEAATGAPCLCVAPDISVRAVFELLKGESASSVLIVDGDQLKGIFTERDALRLMASGADLSQPISAVMSASPVTVSSQASVATAISLMAAGGYRRLPILDAAGQPQGMLQTADIVHMLVEHFPRAIYNLPPVPHQVMQQREGS